VKDQSVSGSLPAKAWAKLRRDGWRPFFAALRWNLYFRHRSVWFELLLDNTVEVIEPRFDGHLEFDDPQRVLNWIRETNEPGTVDAHEIESMLDRDQYFVGILDGDAIVGFVKIGWNRCYVLDYRCDLEIPAGCYFLLDVYVAPGARGKGAGPFLLTAAAVEMRRRGFNRGIMHVRTDKAPMLRSSARAGYRELGQVDYALVLGRHLFRPHPLGLIAK
jgi:GNAT superfamily N-acetyltransferase